MISYYRFELWRKGLSTLALVFCMTAALMPLQLAPLETIERAGYDWRMTLLRQNHAIDPRVVIVDIDERSLAQEGQWPWPRTRIAELLSALKREYQVSAIGLDILFPEQSRTADQDTALKAKLTSSETLLAELFQLEQTQRPLSVAALSPSAPVDNASLTPSAWGYIGNSPSLITSTPAGHISIDVDRDGKSRFLPPLIQWNNRQYTTLSLAILQQLFIISPASLVRPEGLWAPAIQLQAPPFRIPLNSAGRMLIPYQGAAGKYLYIPAIDVLDNSVDAALLRDRIVLIGSSATGLYDMIATPWSKHYPGVEVHATLISALLDNLVIVEPHASRILLPALCLLLFVIVMYAYQRFSLPLTLSISVLLSALWLAGNTLAWHQFQIALPIALPLLLVLSLIFINTPALAVIANHQRQQIFRHFKDYVPGTVVEQLVRESGPQTIQPQRREMSVMFMDIRGFTSISENLTPSQLAELMNRVLSPVTRVIHDQGGTIDKYMGDAVMAFWGAPVPQVDHAERAVSTAIQIHSEIDKLNKELAADGFPNIRVGIGLNSGSVTVGNMGSDFRVSYTVIGDAVNIAARLEGLTKDYQADILIGGTTAEAAKNAFNFNYLGQTVVKGRKKPVHLYEPVLNASQLDKKAETSGGPPR